MPDEEQRRVRKWWREKWRREKWHRQWIARFAERQHCARRWIAVADLVDWCAQSTTAASHEAEAKARDVAYRRLTDSLRKGEFEHDGRSKILYLDTLVTPDGPSPRCRLTREQFEVAFDGAATPPASSWPVPVLDCCWLPRDLAGHWLESHGYRLPPYLPPLRRASPADGGEEPAGGTGFPGRPGKGREPIEAEHNRRTAAGLCRLGVKEEAAELAAWFRREHPTKEQPTPKTIENNIRRAHQRWRGAAQKPRN